MNEIFGRRTKLIHNMSNSEAKSFLLKGESYCRLELPKYFNFDIILSKIDKKLKNIEFNSICDHPENFDNVNYKIFSNKEGVKTFSWTFEGEGNVFIRRAKESC